MAPSEDTELEQLRSRRSSKAHSRKESSVLNFSVQVSADNPGPGWLLTSSLSALPACLPARPLRSIRPTAAGQAGLGGTSNLEDRPWTDAPPAPLATVPKSPQSTCHRTRASPARPTLKWPGPGVLVPPCFGGDLGPYPTHLPRTVQIGAGPV
jgi:hypothetical protein